MARTAAGLPSGMRMTDHMSLGVLTAQFPLEIGEQVLFETERLSELERDLPAHVMVYYAIALALYTEISTREVLRCVVEGARWLGDPSRASDATVMPRQSGISQARTRLGAAPLEVLYRAAISPSGSRCSARSRPADGPSRTPVLNRQLQPGPRRPAPRQAQDE